MPVQDLSNSQVQFNTPSSSQDVRINTDLNSIQDGDMRIVKEQKFEEIDFTFSEGISSSRANRIFTRLSGGIFGMPYQYSEDIDTPVDGTEFGRKYMDKIASIMPVLFICPGEPAFMAGYSDNERKGIMELMDSDSSGVSVDDIITDPEAPYYIFNSKFNKYKGYVNLMVRSLSNFMGLGGEYYYNGSKRLYDFDLSNILNKDFQSLFNANTSVAFYLDAETSVSESFSNTTTESMLTQKVNSLSDTARELQFLVGDMSGISGGIYDALKSTAGDAAGMAEGMFAHLGMNNGILSKITSGLSTVVSGGKMVFPEIWSSSDYSRNYSITMKLRSPDPDPLSILLNIYIPLCCLTGLVMPMQIGNNANGYLSPFLVRATYKSIFNCELGMVTSLDINKGGEDKWNALGMPTSVDVTMTIKDLYSTMFMSRTPSGLSCNMAQLDYLALMAGLDMNKDWLARNVKLRGLLEAGRITNAPVAAWEAFKSGANKTTAGFLNKVLKADVRWNS